MLSHSWHDHFRTRLNAILRQRGIRSKELALALDVHPNTIARWRNGPNTSGISAGSLVELSGALEMSPAEWFLQAAPATIAEEKLRRVLQYLQSLDETQLDYFLTIVVRMIDFAESRSAAPKGVAK